MKMEHSRKQECLTRGLRQQGSAEAERVEGASSGREGPGPASWGPLVLWAGSSDRLQCRPFLVYDACLLVTCSTDRLGSSHNQFAVMQMCIWPGSEPCTSLLSRPAEGWSRPEAALRKEHGGAENQKIKRTDNKRKQEKRDSPPQGLSGAAGKHSGTFSETGAPGVGKSCGEAETGQDSQIRRHRVARTAPSGAGSGPSQPPRQDGIFQKWVRGHLSL